MSLSNKKHIRNIWGSFQKLSNNETEFKKSVAEKVFKKSFAYKGEKASLLLQLDIDLSFRVPQPKRRFRATSSVIENRLHSDWSWNWWFPVTTDSCYFVYLPSQEEQWETVHDDIQWVLHHGWKIFATV